MTSTPSLESDQNSIENEPSIDIMKDLFSQHYLVKRYELLLTPTQDVSQFLSTGYPTLPRVSQSDSTPVVPDQDITSHITHLTVDSYHQYHQSVDHFWETIFNKTAIQHTNSNPLIDTSLPQSTDTFDGMNDSTPSFQTQNTSQTRPNAPKIPTNPIIYLQFNHLLTKMWSSIGIIHLQEFHLNLTILFGINATRYLIPTDCYDKGTYCIKFPDKLYNKYPWLHHWRHSPVVDQFKHKIPHFHPQKIYSILSHLYHTDQFSPILNHYLLRIVSIPSFINLITAIISPHFDIIIPLTLPYTPTPALFHLIFTILSLLYHDLLELLQPIFALLFSEPNLDIITLNTQPFSYAQPGPFEESGVNITKLSKHGVRHRDDLNHVGSEQNILFGNELRPASILINTLLDDGSSNVTRVTNGMK